MYLSAIMASFRGCSRCFSPSEKKSASDAANHAADQLYKLLEPTKKECLAKYLKLIDHTIVLSDQGKQKFNSQYHFIRDDDFSKAMDNIFNSQCSINNNYRIIEVSNRDDIKQILLHVKTHESTDETKIQNYADSHKNTTQINEAILCTPIKINDRYYLLILDGHHRIHAINTNEKITSVNFHVIKYPENGCQYLPNSNYTISPEVVLFLASLEPNERVSKITSHAALLA